MSVLGYNIPNISIHVLQTQIVVKSGNTWVVPRYCPLCDSRPIFFFIWKSHHYFVYSSPHKRGLADYQPHLCHTLFYGGDLLGMSYAFYYGPVIRTG
jgi:hypothetical protein